MARLLAIYAVLAPLLVLDCQAVNIVLQSSPPSNSRTLARTLVSFSLEQDRWPDWSGVYSRNEFTHHALTRYAQLTGEPPKIRVGANSEDHTFWDPTVKVVEQEFPPSNTITPYPEATHITVGDTYYELSRFLPRGTHMTWGLNFGADNATNAVDMAKAIVHAFRTPAVKASGVVLDLVELGNEPDLFKNKGLRPANWTVQEYVQDWIAMAEPVVKAIGINQRDGPISLQGASFAGQGFTPRQIFDLGILDSVPGRTISVISQHRYSAAFCDGGDFPLTSFMSKPSVRGNLTVFVADIAATHAQGLPYILGETNSIACHGAPGVSNTAGAALWTIDYTLQAATLGIKEVFFHEGIGFKYNFIQPVTLNRSTIDGSPLDPPAPAHVQPGFYAGLVVNTFIGKTGSSRIVELAVDDANVAGYAAYEHGHLARAVFINLHAWLASSTGARPSIHLDLAVALEPALSAAADRRGDEQKCVPASGRRWATARRLVVERADDVAGLVWAGQSYENEDVRPRGRVVIDRFELGEGVDLRSTEAVLIEF